MKQPTEPMKKKILKTVVILFTIFFVFSIIRTLILENNLKRNKIIVNGFITEYSTSYRGGLEIIYTFEFKSKVYKGETAYPEIYSRHSNRFVGRYFPVIFTLDNPNFNKILISTSKFKKYNIEFPDSLKWVIKFEK